MSQNNYSSHRRIIVASYYDKKILEHFSQKNKDKLPKKKQNLKFRSYFSISILFKKKQPMNLLLHILKYYSMKINCTFYILRASLTSNRCIVSFAAIHHIYACLTLLHSNHNGCCEKEIRAVKTSDLEIYRQMEKRIK